jgi:hypothetical protein
VGGRGRGSGRRRNDVLGIAGPMQEIGSASCHCLDHPVWRSVRGIGDDLGAQASSVHACDSAANRSWLVGDQHDAAAITRCGEVSEAIGYDDAPLTGKSIGDRRSAIQVVIDQNKFEPCHGAVFRGC